jgi:hypothetical protein
LQASKERTSFLKKRSKKLLVLAAGRFAARRPGAKVFCRAFFQKSAYLLAYQAPT